MKRKANWIEASSSKKQSTSMEKSLLEDLCERFPYIGEEILKNLDDKTIAKCTLVSKTMHAFIGKQKVFWIRKIMKYVGEGFELTEMWKEFLYQTPQEIVKKMSNAVYDCFNQPLTSFDYAFWSSFSLCKVHILPALTWSPLQFAVGANNELLSKFILDKIGVGSRFLQTSEIGFTLTCLIKEQA